jgi:hypothetical protein
MNRSPVSDLVSKNADSQLWRELVEFSRTLKGMQRVVLDELLKHDGEISRETIDANPDLRLWSQDLNQDESFKSVRTKIEQKASRRGNRRGNRGANCGRRRNQRTPACDRTSHLICPYFGPDRAQALEGILPLTFVNGRFACPSRNSTRCL